MKIRVNSACIDEARAEMSRMAPGFSVGRIQDIVADIAPASVGIPAHRPMTAHAVAGGAAVVP